MARAILPDTDVVVDFFRGYEKATLDSFICLFRVIPVDSEIAKAQGGALQARLQQVARCGACRRDTGGNR